MLAIGYQTRFGIDQNSAILSIAWRVITFSKFNLLSYRFFFSAQLFCLLQYGSSLCFGLSRYLKYHYQSKFLSLHNLVILQQEWKTTLQSENAGRNCYLQLTANDKSWVYTIAYSMTYRYRHGNLRFCGVYHTTSQLKLEVTTNMQSLKSTDTVCNSKQTAYKIL